MDKKQRHIEFDSLFKEEVDFIRQKPGKSDVKEDNLVGLAISGGGIRSAALGMGVLHGLVGADRLKDIDYLSTVSGGGYTGSALTWALHQSKKKEEDLVRPSGFPLGQPGKGAHTSTANDRLNYIRQHANYLCPGHGLDIISILGLFLRGLTLGNLVYLPLIALFLYVAQPWNLSNDYIGAVLGFIALFGIGSILFSIFVYFSCSSLFAKKQSEKSTLFAYRLRNACQRWLGKLLIAIFLFLLIWSLKPVSELLQSHSISGFIASISTGVGYLGFLFNMKKKQAAPNSSSGILTTIIAIFSVSLLLYGLLLFTYMIAEQYPTVLWISLCGSLVIGFLANLNIIGFHRVYRDRLMETFLPDLETIKNQSWDLAKEASIAPLHEMCDAKTPGPYHILCGTVVLKNSKTTSVRARGGDSFLMSRLFCGSSATGWQKTKEFMNGKLHLGTAMAISAAAANPYIGEAHQGLTTVPLISFFMTLLGIRMGYITPNPNHKRASKKGWIPNFLFPGLLDLLGLGYSEKSAYIEIADGGGFENLAIYELIRRQMKVIIMTDNGADITDSFSDLANAIERVRVDFGTDIQFDQSEYDLRWLLSGTAAPGPFTDQYSLAKRGFAIGEINYPDGSKGKIFYIKSTLTEGLPADLYGYKSDHPTFPSQSTADQFFSEPQFEAYRELGYRITTDLLNHLDENWSLLPEVKP